MKGSQMLLDASKSLVVGIALVAMLVMSASPLCSADTSVEVLLQPKEKNCRFDPDRLEIVFQSERDRTQNIGWNGNEYSCKVSGNQISFHVPVGDLPVKIRVTMSRSEADPFDILDSLVVKSDDIKDGGCMLQVKCQKCSFHRQKVRMVDSNTKLPLAHLHFNVDSIPYDKAKSAVTAPIETSADGDFGIVMWTDSSYCAQFDPEEFTQDNIYIEPAPGKVVVLAMERVPTEAICKVVLQSGEIIRAPNANELPELHFDLFRSGSDKPLAQFYAPRDPSGKYNFNIKQEPSGTYKLKLSNLPQSLRLYKIASGEKITLPAQITAPIQHHIVIAKRSDFSLSIQVVEKSTGLPLPGVSVVGHGEDAATLPARTTDANGKIDWGLVPEGTYSVDISTKVLGPVASLAIDHTKNETISLEADTKAVLEARRKASLRQEVSDFIAGEFYPCLVVQPGDLGPQSDAAAGPVLRKWRDAAFTLKEFGGAQTDAVGMDSPLEKELMDVLRTATKSNPFFTLTAVPLDVRGSALQKHWSGWSDGTNIPKEVTAAFAGMDDAPYKQAAKEFRAWIARQIAQWPQWKRERYELLARVNYLLDLEAERALSVDVPKDKMESWTNQIGSIHSVLQSQLGPLTEEKLPDHPFAIDPKAALFWDYAQTAAKSNPCFADLSAHMTDAKFKEIYSSYVKQGRAKAEQVALDKFENYILSHLSAGEDPVQPPEKK